MKKPQKFVGLRVKQAREVADLTQEQLAERLGFSDRQTLSDVETGKRTLKPDELFTLSQATGQDVDYFVNPFSVAGEAKFAWRVDKDINDEILGDFESNAGQWIGLLRWLRDQYGERPSVFEETLRPPRTFEEANDRAEDLVREWDLGDFPAERLLNTVEQRLNVPVIFVDTLREGDKAVSGAACHLDDLNVILINRNETDGRRNYNLAHELFHVLTWDALTPERNELRETKRSQRIERLADQFAAALLMPKASIEKRVDRIRTADIKSLCELAAAFRVSPKALAWRLFNLKLITEDVRKRLDQCRSQEGTKPRLFSTGFVRMLHEAIDRGRLSARKAAKLLGCEMDELLRLFQDYDLASPLNA